MLFYHGAFALAFLASGSLGATARKAAPSPRTIDEDFAAFIAKHGRKYKHDSQEYEKRRAIFETVTKQVESQNKQPGRSFRSRVNKFADRTHEELAKLRGWKSGNRPRHSAAPQGEANTFSSLSTAMNVVELPKEHSWTNLTAVKEIQDQGGCGSCWAFASATVLRAHSEIWMKDPRKFSVQQIISCTSNPQECGGTGGCNGATAELAMDYVFKHGCRTEDELPYTEQDTDCPHSLLQEPSSGAEDVSASTSLGMLGWTKLPENKVGSLKLALVTKGPVAVSISAGHSWNQYDGGVLDDCPKDAIIDHAVVLIGYGEAKALDDGAEGGLVAKPIVKFWHLQNSWGTDWGERGYLRMLRRDDTHEESEQCGVDNNPAIGSGCKGGPPEVSVCGMCGLLYDTVIPHFADKRNSGEVKKHGNFLQQH